MTKVNKESVNQQESSDTSNKNESLVLEDDSDMDCDIVEDEAECKLFCSGLFSEDHEGEQWIRCYNCSKWAHFFCPDGDENKHTYVILPGWLIPSTYPVLGILFLQRKFALPWNFYFFIYGKN